MKILVVDDDPLIRELLQESMYAAGFEDLVLAASAVEAAQAITAEETPFDCMFIDIRMPEIEGDYLCEWVRQLPAYAATPIIMITALSDKKDIDRAFAAGASDYITKPIDLTKFIFHLRLIARELRKTKVQTGNVASTGEKAEVVLVDFDKHALLGDIDKELDLAALENYAKLISRSGIPDMSVFAVAIADAQTFHRLLPVEDFADLLRSAGQEISKHLGGAEFFMAYAGKGTFACVLHGRPVGPQERDRFEQTVRAALDDIRIELSNGKQLSVRPCMGLPRKMAVWVEQNAGEGLRHAVADAIERADEL